MPSMRTYNLTLSPCKIEHGGFSYVLFDPRAKKYVIDAASLTDLIEQINAKAREFGQDCAVSCRVSSGERKPPRFDAMMAQLQYIKFEPKLEEGSYVMHDGRTGCIKSFRSFIEDGRRRHVATVEFIDGGTKEVDTAELTAVTPERQAALENGARIQRQVGSLLGL